MNNPLMILVHLLLPQKQRWAMGLPHYEEWIMRPAARLKGQGDGEKSLWYHFCLSLQ
jgi:hypothetical protein